MTVATWELDVRRRPGGLAALASLASLVALACVVLGGLGACGRSELDEGRASKDGQAVDAAVDVAVDVDPGRDGREPDLTRDLGPDLRRDGGSAGCVTLGIEPHVTLTYEAGDASGAGQGVLLTVERCAISRTLDCCRPERAVVDRLDATGAWKRVTCPETVPCCYDTIVCELSGEGGETFFPIDRATLCDCLDDVTDPSTTIRLGIGYGMSCDRGERSLATAEPMLRSDLCGR